MRYLKRGIPVCLLILALVVSVAFLTPKAQAATSGTCGDNLTWSLSSAGTLTISGTGPMTDYSYSSSMPWYSNSGSIESVVIKSGVTTVGKYAFSYCHNLQSVTLPSTVTTVGAYAFYRSEKLSGITIPDSVTLIDHYAFQYCTGLQSVSIGKNVATLGTSAFANSGIQSVSLPDNIQAVGNNAFWGCDNLSFTVYENAKYLGNSQNPYLVLIDTVSYDISSCKIHKNTKVLGDHALSHHKQIQSITIPEGVRTIGALGFYNCEGLQSITIPDSVTTIRSQAFDGCKALQSVTLGKNLTTIGGYAFRACESLTSVTIPASVTTINNAPFAGCPNLTEIIVTTGNSYYCNDAGGVLLNKNKTKIIQVPGGLSGHYTVPATVTEIGSSVFSNCANLRSVTIPDGVTTIGSGAFSKCTSLESVVMPDSVTTVAGSVFADCAALKSVQLSDSLSSIGDSMFARCKNLQSIVIPNSVTSIGSSAFSECHALQNVTMSSYTKTIGYGAFSNCAALASIDIPSTVTSIGNSAFQGCDSLTGFWVHTDNAKYSSDETGVLFDKNKTTLIQAPCVLQAYTIPGSVNSIGSGAFSRCTALQNVVIPGSVATIGENAFSGCAALKSVTIPDSVTEISSFAFQACSGLKSVSIPDSVTYVGSGIFKDCTGLESATLGKRVTYLHFDSYSYLFNGCENLTGIWVSEENAQYSSDENGVLFNKNKTTLLRVPSGISGNYTIPDSVTKLGDNAFAGCNRLQTITISANVSAIGTCALDNCADLSAIYVDDNNANFSNDSNGAMFDKNKTALLRLPNRYAGHYFIPEGVQTVAGGAFYNCTDLTDLTVPASVNTFSAYFVDENGAYIYSFETCTALADIYFAGTQSRWGEICNDYGAEAIKATIHTEHTHDYSVFPPETVAATCETDGYIIYTCAYDLSDTYKKILPALGHEAGADSITVAATCTTDGYTQSTCTRCGELAESQIIPKLGHDYSGPEMSVLHCTENGYAGASCTRCDSVRNDRTVGPAGHSPELINVKAPTCEEEGYTTAGTRCSRCHTVFVVPTPSPALGHDYVEGVCTRCEAVDPEYVPEYIPGDMDGDKLLTNDDVIWLLWYSLFPEEMNGDAQIDLTGDGLLTNADVITLLWHVLFPEDFPL